MKDEAGLKTMDFCTTNVSTNMKEESPMFMSGVIIDRIYKNDVLIEEIIGHNIVVDSFKKLITCLLKNQSGYSGIQYWAVGSGSDTWDTSMPNPNASEVKLTNEISRVPISASDITFLTDDLKVTSTPTNIIQITHKFGIDDCNGVWREFGIFGGNATSVKDSGIMIDKKHHAKITKDRDTTIERVIRFNLSLNNIV